MSYKLYYFDWTGLGEISRLIFALKEVQYEDVRIPLFSEHFPLLPPEWKAKTPWGQVPILEVDGKKIAQSFAINRFLARRFNLAGADEFEAAKCDELMDALRDFLTEWQKVFMAPDLTKQAEVMNNVLEVAVPKYLGKYNQIIVENGGKYLVGNGLTWADVCLIHLTTYFETFFVCEFIKNYPAVAAMVKTFYDIPQIKKWTENGPNIMNMTYKDFNEKLKIPKK